MKHTGGGHRFNKSRTDIEAVNQMRLPVGVIKEEPITARESDNTYSDDKFEEMSKSHFSASKSRAKGKPNSDSYSNTFDESARSASKQLGIGKQHKVDPITEELKEASMGDSNTYTDIDGSGSTSKMIRRKFNNGMVKVENVSSSEEKTRPLQRGFAIREPVIEKSHGQTTISVSGLSSSMLPRGADHESQGTEQESDTMSVSQSDNKANQMWNDLRKKYLGKGAAANESSTSPLSSDTDN